MNFSASLPPSGSRAAAPSPPAGLLFLLSLRDGTLFCFLFLSFQPFYSCLLPPSSPPPRTCVQTPLRNAFALRLSCSSAEHKPGHIFSVVTYSGLVLLAHYYYAVLYKHLNENCYGLLCLLDRPMLCCVFPLFPVFISHISGSDESQIYPIWSVFFFPFQHVSLCSASVIMICVRHPERGMLPGRDEWWKEVWGFFPVNKYQSPSQLL